MNAAKVIGLLCDTSNIPLGMRFIGFKEINEFDKISYIECVSYQVAILEDEFDYQHLLSCMSGDLQEALENLIVADSLYFLILHKN